MDCAYKIYYQRKEQEFELTLLGRDFFLKK
jgi:hypothetical protein